MSEGAEGVSECKTSWEQIALAITVCAGVTNLRPQARSLRIVEELVRASSRFELIKSAEEICVEISSWYESVAKLLVRKKNSRDQENIAAFIRRTAINS
jgi:hypothetical protein